LAPLHKICTPTQTSGKRRQAHPGAHSSRAQQTTIPRILRPWIQRSSSPLWRRTLNLPSERRLRRVHGTFETTRESRSKIAYSAASKPPSGLSASVRQFGWKHLLWANHVLLFHCCLDPASAASESLTTPLGTGNCGKVVSRTDHFPCGEGHTRRSSGRLCRNREHGHLLAVRHPAAQ
jgi:hypothetical protein